MPSIDRNSPEPFYLQVYGQIARGIESGLYPAGKKLPSIRECARELGVSNTTIELAYQKLTEEGYVQARRGSGYTICELNSAVSNPALQFSHEYQEALEQLTQSENQRENAPRPRYDFAYDAIDRSVFPFTTWARISREVFFAQGSEDARLYNDRQGLAALREQIARYVCSEYGLSCSPEQVLVMPTTRDLVSEVMALFDPATTRFAIEDPGYDEVSKQLTALGYDVATIPITPYPTWEETLEFIDGANIVFVTPGCQFPTNRPMPLELRQRLVDWARENGAYLIDDEYGWEFQSGIARTPSPTTLDRAGRVITLGTFSNSFTPAISLSYAILPPQLMLKWQQSQRSAHPQVPWQTQAAMAMFMNEGHWRMHIRKARTTMTRKRNALLAALERHMGESVEVVLGPSSLFALVKTVDGRCEKELVEAASARGVRVYPTSQYWHDEPPEDWTYVLVGYASIEEGDIDPGIRALARAWGFSC